jgi:hypothetical protein
MPQMTTAAVAAIAFADHLLRCVARRFLKRSRARAFRMGGSPPALRGAGHRSATDIAEQSVIDSVRSKAENRGKSLVHVTRGSQVKILPLRPAFSIVAEQPPTEIPTDIRPLNLESTRAACQLARSGRKFEHAHFGAICSAHVRAKFATLGITKDGAPEDCFYASAPDCGSGGRWFESTQLYQLYEIVQHVMRTRLLSSKTPFLSGPMADLAKQVYSLSGQS